MRSVYITLALLMVLAGTTWAQTCAITAPTASQVIQLTHPPTFQLTATISGVPTASRLQWLIDDLRALPEDSVYFSPGTQPPALTWYPYLLLDGTHTAQALVWDALTVPGTGAAPLATCSKVTFVIRINGYVGSLSSAPTTGSSGTLTMFGGGNAGNSALWIDGIQYFSGVNTLCTGSYSGTSNGLHFVNFNTTCLPNGTHEYYVINENNQPSEPINPANIFTSTSVSGTNITLTPSFWAPPTAFPVTFATTGTLPAPLVPGILYTWTSSASSPNTLTNFSCTSGTCTATGLSTNPGSPTTVNVHGTYQWNTTTGASLCDGLFTVTGSTSTTLSWTAANCPNGTYNHSGTDIATNPYFPIFVSADATGTVLQFSATPNGSAITFTNGGSGTHTLNYHFRSNYTWNVSGIGGDSLGGNLWAAGVGRQLVTTSNGSAAMALWPPYTRINLCLTPTASCPSSISIAPSIRNTDGSTTTIAANSVGYNYLDDGGYSGVAAVNTTTGVLTASSTGWATVQETCSTCNAGGALVNPPLIYVRVYNNIVNPHFGKHGVIQTSYVPGESFFPTSMWHLEVRGATTDTSDPGLRTTWLGKMMTDAGINIAQSGLYGTTDPSNNSLSCGTYPTTRDALIRPYAAQYNLGFEYDFSYFTAQPFQVWGLVHNIQFNRQTCLRNYILDIQAATTAPVFRGFLSDELNQDIGGSAPNRNGLIGQGMLTQISIAAGGLATMTGDFSYYGGPWNQANGAGIFFKLSGSSSGCLNNVFPILSIPTTAAFSGDGTSATFQTTCTAATHTAGNDAALLLDFFPFSATNALVPAAVGVSTCQAQNWTTTCPVGIGGAGPGSSIAITSIVSDGATPATLTVNCTACGYTGNGASGSDIIHIQLATTPCLNTIGYATRVNANSFTVPAQEFCASGTYTSSTDANLILWRDADLPTSYWTTLRSIVSGTVLTAGVLGDSYGNLGSVNGWQGDARLVPGASQSTDAPLNYNPGSPNCIYGQDCSVAGVVGDYQSSNVISRAYQLDVRGTLPGAGPQIIKFCPQTIVFNPACDIPQTLYWRPATFTGAMMTAITNGEKSIRIYNYGPDKNGEYATQAGRGAGSNSISPGYAPKQWAAMAHTFQLIGRLNKYQLQPQLAGIPYYGRGFAVDAHTGSYGNDLMLVCQLDGGAHLVQTIDLTPIRIAGGSIYRASNTGYRLLFAPLAGNPTSDSYDFCAADAGETVVYVAQPPGAQPDLDLVQFTPPASLPFGATHFAIRTIYYSGATNDDPVTPCDSGCTIPIHHTNMNAWYQVLYLDSNHLPIVSNPDPIQIPSQGRN